MNQADLDRFRELARTRLSDERFGHVLGVTRLAGELAAHYGEDVTRAKAAGLLHDITKELPKAEQLQMMKDSGIIYSQELLESPNVYHSITGSLYVREALGIRSADILDGIRYHTTGRAGMSRFEKLVYIADATSYEREYPDAPRLRELAFRDLDACMLEILVFTIEKLVKRRITIASDTLFCYNEMCKLSRGTSPGPEQKG